MAVSATNSKSLPISFFFFADIKTVSSVASPVLAKFSKAEVSALIFGKIEKFRMMKNKITANTAGPSVASNKNVALLARSFAPDVALSIIIAYSSPPRVIGVKAAIPVFVAATPDVVARSGGDRNSKSPRGRADLTPSFCCQTAGQRSLENGNRLVKLSSLLDF